jgi:hypothetical protein
LAKVFQDFHLFSVGWSNWALAAILLFFFERYTNSRIAASLPGGETEQVDEIANSFYKNDVQDGEKALQTAIKSLSMCKTVS